MKNVKQINNKISKSYLYGIAIVFLVLSTMLIAIGTGNLAKADTYGNYAGGKVYASGWLGCAWVIGKWIFATCNNGDFMLNQNTRFVTSTGSTGFFSAGITGCDVSSSSTYLDANVDYCLSSIGWSSTGTLSVQVCYVGNGQYEVYIIVYGTHNYYGPPELVTLPIEILLDFAE